MTWTSHHRRSDVLRRVIASADQQPDGLLPMGVDGVAETFRDERTLVGALALVWHTRLAGRIEAALHLEPSDLEAAVARAWRTTADDLPGTRAILDRHRAEPLDDEMARDLAISAEKEHVLLAIAAGQASGADPLAVRAGQRIADRARHSAPERRSTSTSLVDRLRAVLHAA